MKKRLYFVLSLIVILAMSFGVLAGCGGGNSEAESSNESADVSEAVEEETEEDELSLTPGGSEAELEGSWVHTTNQIMLTFDGDSGLSFQNLNNSSSGVGEYSYDGDTISVIIVGDSGEPELFEGYIDDDGDMVIELWGEGSYYIYTDEENINLGSANSDPEEELVEGPAADIVGYWENSETMDSIQFYADGSAVYSILGTSGMAYPFSYDGDTIEFGDYTGYLDADGLMYIEGINGYFTNSDYAGDGGEYEADPDHGVLVLVAGFTGTTPVESDEDYYGGYYYKEITEDSMTEIINCGVPNDFISDEETLEGYVGRVIELISYETPYDIYLVDTGFDSYGGYYAEWYTGEDENALMWSAQFVLTDNYTYVYAYNAIVDHAYEMYDTWTSSFDQLELTFPYEE